MKEKEAKASRLNLDKVREEVTTAGKNVWFAGLGAVAMVEDESRALFDRLVDRGKDFEKREKSAVSRAFDDVADRAKKLGRRVEDGVQDRVAGTLHRFGVPTHGEIRELITRVEELNAKVDSIRAQK